MRTLVFAAVLALLTAQGDDSCRAGAWFRGVGEIDARPRAVSGDGGVIVGDHYPGSALETGWHMYSSDAAPTQLTYSTAVVDASNYGIGLVGTMESGGEQHPFVVTDWSSPQTYDEASVHQIEVEGEATCVIGYSDWAGYIRRSDGGRAAVTGYYPNFREVGDLPGGADDSAVYGSSGDGRIVVGFGTSVSGRQATRWRTSFDGQVHGLGDLTEVIVESTANAASWDGAFIVGYGTNAAGEHEAFLWTYADGMSGLDSADLADRSSASDLSSDGRVVVGGFTSAGDDEAFYWNPIAGMRSLQDMLAEQFGLDLGGWELLNATGVSASGLTIVGEGINPAGHREGWIAHVPRGSITGDANGDGFVDLDDLNLVLDHFGESGTIGAVAGDTYPYNGSVDLRDLNAVRNYFAQAGDLPAVPEPSAIILALLSGLAGLALHRGRIVGAVTCCTMVMSALAASSSAATVYVTPSIAGVLNEDFSLVDPDDVLAPGVLRRRAEPYLVSIEFSMTISDLQEGQVGFSNTAFDIEIEGASALESPEIGFQPWFANDAQIDFNGPIPGGVRPLWEINADRGADQSDLRAIILAGATRNFGPGPFDVRRILGQDSPAVAGWIYLEVPGNKRLATLDVLTPYGASTYDATGFSTVEGNTAIGGSVTIRVPEPNSIWLALWGALFAVIARLKFHRVRIIGAVTCCTMVMSALAASSSAATVYVTPSIEYVLNEDFTPVDPGDVLAPGVLRRRAEPYLVGIEFRMRIRELAGDQVGFSNTAFHVQLRGDGIAYTDPDSGIAAWNSDNPTICTFGCTYPGGDFPLWDINADEGANKNDLQSIILASVTHGFGPFQFDERRFIGKDEDGSVAGRVLIHLPGDFAPSSVEVLTPFGASTYDATGFSTVEGNTAIGGSVTIRVPEPQSFWLVTVGAFLAGLSLYAGRGPRS